MQDAYHMQSMRNSSTQRRDFAHETSNITNQQQTRKSAANCHFRPQIAVMQVSCHTQQTGKSPMWHDHCRYHIRYEISHDRSIQRNTDAPHKQYERILCEHNTQYATHKQFIRNNHANTQSLSNMQAMHTQSICNLCAFHRQNRQLTRKMEANYPQYAQ